MDEIVPPKFEGVFRDESHRIMGMNNPKSQKVADAILGRDQEFPQPQPQIMGQPSGYTNEEFAALAQQQAMSQQQQQQPMVQQQIINPQIAPIAHEDPFALAQYNNVQIPDQPIQFGGGMAEQLLNDNEVPEEIRKKYWFIFHKDNVLTFLDENRKQSKLLNFDIIKIDYLNTLPYYDYDFEQEMTLTVLRNVYETKLDRALGFKGAGTKNERVMLQSQFTEQRQISETGDSSMIKEGFFKRLLGRR